MRFTIRDLLWLTVVVALGVAWWLDRSRLASEAARAGQWQEVAIWTEQRVLELESRLQRATLQHAPQNPPKE